MSPIVPTRTVSAMRSVETPRSAATPALGRMRISVRSSGAVESHVDEVGHGEPPRAAGCCRHVSDDEAQVRPGEMMSARSRCPLSRSDQNRMSGSSRRIVPTDDPVELLLRAMTCVLRRQVDGEATRAAPPSWPGNWRPPSTNTLRTSGSALILSTMLVRDAGGVGEAWRTGRQFHDEDRSCRILCGKEAGGQQPGGHDRPGKAREARRPA